MSTNYEIDYSDERLAQVKTDEKTALSDVEKTYGGMIDNSEKYYQAQIDASKEWANEQTQLQQEKTDFAVEEIKQQKAQAQKDYTKEQSGAYVDWQKQSNQYGANAEQMVASGMANTGYSESSQVSMYNAYQNRVATARDVYNRAVLNYDNGITEARMQNNAALAEIRFSALQQQLELSLQGFQYENSLISEMANKKTELENIYHNRYLNVLDQINTENALAEEIRQFNASLAEERRQYDASLALQQAELSEYEAAISDAKRGTSEGSSVKPNINSVENSKAHILGTTTKESSDPPVNEESIRALGYGNISAAKLNKLVESGKVVEFVKNGQIYFCKAEDIQEDIRPETSAGSGGGDFYLKKE